MFSPWKIKSIMSLRAFAIAVVISVFITACGGAGKAISGKFLLFEHPKDADAPDAIVFLMMGDMVKNVHAGRPHEPIPTIPHRHETCSVSVSTRFQIPPNSIGGERIKD